MYLNVRCFEEYLLHFQDMGSISPFYLFKNTFYDQISLLWAGWQTDVEAEFIFHSMPIITKGNVNTSEEDKVPIHKTETRSTIKLQYY